MAKSIYFECYRGISGDMAAAVMIDAGADRNVLAAALDSVPVKGFSTEISRVTRNGIDCCDFAVITDEESSSHDHDMAYLYGHEKSAEYCPENEFHNHPAHTHNSGELIHSAHFHTNEEDGEEEELSVNMKEIISHVESHIHTGHAHGHTHSHNHGHSHEHHEEVPEHSGGHAHSHTHRGIDEILEIIDKTQMTDGARHLARRIFNIIAAAESAAHGVPVKQVHFHEAGALDSIADVIALSVCYDNLASRYGIKETYFPCICEGTGTVRCQHGVLPVPVPAVVNIAAEYGLPLRIINTRGELATPTGAAFAAATGTKFCMPPAFRIISAGTGAGKRAYGIPSTMRAMIIDTMDQDNTEGGKQPDSGSATDSDEDSVYVFRLETNIDDCPGEALGFAMEELMKHGALDVHYVPCYMKKNRPAYILNVICSEDKIRQMEEIIFRHTSTTGIRRVKMERSVLPRRIIQFESPYGRFSAKESVCGNLRKISPEYRDVAEICRRTGMPFAQIYMELQKICGE